MAAQRAHPALLGHHDGDRLAHHHRLFDRGLVVLGRLGEIGAALAERRLLAELLAHLLDLRGDRLPLLLLGLEQLFERLLLGAKLLVLLADLHFLELAQIAQAHVEDGVGLHVGELERLHQDGLRLVLGADDLDDLVEVEIGDQVAAEHFEAVLDLLQAVLRAAQQHVAAMVEPFAQRFGKAEHLRDAAFHQHVHVERNAAFQLGELEQRLHQQLGIDGARARLDHEADVFGGFVAHVGDQRQLLLVDQLGDLLDQARLLHQPRNFRDDDDVGAAPGVFLAPARAHAERAAPGRIGLGDLGARIDDQPAGRKIRPRHVFQQRLGARFGLSIRCSAASHSSAALCGGIEVAMPTAMPCAPLASRFGNAAGSTIGSSDCPS